VSSATAQVSDRLPLTARLDRSLSLPNAVLPSSQGSERGTPNTSLPFTALGSPCTEDAFFVEHDLVPEYPLTQKGDSSRLPLLNTPSYDLLDPGMVSPPPEEDDFEMDTLPLVSTPPAKLKRRHPSTSPSSSEEGGAFPSKGCGSRSFFTVFRSSERYCLYIAHRPPPAPKKNKPEHSTQVQRPSSPTAAIRTAHPLGSSIVVPGVTSGPSQPPPQGSTSSTSGPREHGGSSMAPAPSGSTLSRFQTTRQKPIGTPNTCYRVTATH
jgi:hypothetical protein